MRREGLEYRAAPLPRRVPYSRTTHTREGRVGHTKTDRDNRARATARITQRSMVIEELGGSDSICFRPSPQFQ